MSIKIYPFKEQAVGEFNDGEILENRPVVMSHNPKYLLPYSSLFYWAHAWSETGSTIGEHPHKAFEIITFIIKGNIEHYDSKNMQWIPIEEGGAQIIRAGSGISHSEKLNAGSHVFQVWFDPDIKKAMKVPASYNNFVKEDFPVTVSNGFEIRHYIGKGSPLKMETPEITAIDIKFKSGVHKVKIESGKINSVYLIEGKVNINAGEMNAVEMNENDFAVISDEKEITIETRFDGRMFVIESPLMPGYQTYAEMR